MTPGSLFGTGFLGLLAGAAARPLTVYNGCPFIIWPAMYTGSGAAPNYPSGWTANPSTSVTFEVLDNWTAGRIWARRNCDFSTNPGPNSCLDGGCNGGLVCTQPGIPPATLAEFTLAGDGNTDYYDVSSATCLRVSVILLVVVQLIVLSTLVRTARHFSEVRSIPAVSQLAARVHVRPTWTGTPQTRPTAVQVNTALRRPALPRASLIILISRIIVQTPTPTPTTSPVEPRCGLVLLLITPPIQLPSAPEMGF